MSTIISHFYNEEYLLPYWLNHHKRIFKNGIMIDYDSTDDSVNIIKTICPNWTIIKSSNREFGAHSVDREVMSIEESISGWKMILNTTEFLIVSELDSILSKYKSPTMLSSKGAMLAGIAESPDIRNIKFGNISNKHRRNRKIHNFINGAYDTGRHDSGHPSIEEEMYTVWYRYFPWNYETKKRKLQIQTRIPQQDKILRLGFQHIVTSDELDTEYERNLNDTYDLFSDPDFKSTYYKMINTYY